MNKGQMLDFYRNTRRTREAEHLNGGDTTGGEAAESETFAETASDLDVDQKPAFLGSSRERIRNRTIQKARTSAGTSPGADSFSGGHVCVTERLTLMIRCAIINDGGKSVPHRGQFHPPSFPSQNFTCQE